MNERIKELKDNLKWVDSLTSEQQHQWYLTIKESLPIWREIGGVEELERAVLDYETRNGFR